MFLHNLKYELKAGLRGKVFIIWLVIFPIALGTMFKIAFASVYSQTTQFKTIPAAVVTDGDDATLRSVLEGIETSDSPMMKVTYTDLENAEKLLLDGEVEGVIISESSTLRLKVSGLGMNETMLKAFCDQYNANVTVITEAAMNDPASVPAVTEKLLTDANTREDIKLISGNTDYYVDYFYNLLAMVALYGSLIGFTIVMDNQANMSPLGARKNCSPTHKSVSLLAALVSRCIMQTGVMLLSLSYVILVLKIDFGTRLPLVYFTAIVAGFVGVAFGFMVGALGRGKSGKDGLNTVVLSVVMLCCFLSGLMVANMQIIVEQKAPWFNRVNPAAVISDSFHILNTFDDLGRYYTKLITMAAMTVLFALVGFIATRRRKYASL